MPKEDNLDAVELNVSYCGGNFTWVRCWAGHERFAFRLSVAGYRRTLLTPSTKEESNDDQQGRPRSRCLQ